MRDLLLGQTWLLSQHRPSPSPTRLISANPVFGVDGRTVLFQSFAGDLADADFNGTADFLDGPWSRCSF